MNNEKRLNRLKEKILNLEKGISLIEIRLKSAYDKINPNLINTREQESIQKFIETTEKGLTERKFELLQLHIEYNSEYNNTTNINAKMESDEENHVAKTSISEENTENNNLVETAKIGEIGDDADKGTDKNPINKGIDTVPTDKPEDKTIQASTGTIPKITEHGSHIRAGNLKLNLPLSDQNIQDYMNPNKNAKRLGPFENFLEKSKLKPIKIQQGTPIKYDDFSNNLVFGKERNWVPNKSFEYRTGTNIEDDYQGLYDNKVKTQNPIQKTPKFNELSSEELDKINNMFELMQPNKVNNKSTFKQTERDNKFENQIFPEAKKEEVSMNVTFDPKIQTPKNDANVEKTFNSQNIKDSFNFHREKLRQGSHERDDYENDHFLLDKNVKFSDIPELINNQDILRPFRGFENNPRQGFQKEIPTFQNDMNNKRIHSNKNEPRTIYLKRLASIPDLEGDSFENLKRFIEKIDTLYHSAINDSEINELYEQMLLKITGEARNIIIKLENLNWENIKTKLYSHFSHLCNKSLLTTQLENLKQEKDESLSDYAERARKLLDKKNAMYNNLTQDQKEEHNRTAYKAFTKGLNDRLLKERALTRGASSLEDAIENALDMENDSSNMIPKTDLFCKYCRMVGHRESDCRRKKISDDPILRFVNALRDTGPVNFSRSNIAYGMPRRPNNLPPRNSNYRSDRFIPNRYSGYPNQYGYDNQRNRYGDNPYQNRNYPNPYNNNEYQNQNQYENRNNNNQYNNNNRNNLQNQQPNQFNRNRNMQNNNNDRRNMNSINNIAMNQRIRENQNSEN